MPLSLSIHPIHCRNSMTHWIVAEFCYNFLKCLKLHLLSFSLCFSFSLTPRPCVNPWVCLCVYMCVYVCLWVCVGDVCWYGRICKMNNLYRKVHQLISLHLKLDIQDWGICSHREPHIISLQKRKLENILVTFLLQWQNNDHGSLQNSLSRA